MSLTIGPGVGWAGAGSQVAGVAGVRGAPSSLPAGGTTIAIADNPSAIRVTPDQKYAYIPAFTDNVVSVVDLRSRLLVANIPVGQGPSDMAFNRSGRIGYVANSRGGSISVIDTTSRKVTRTIAVDGSPSAVGVRATRNGDQLFVADFWSGVVRQVAAGSGATTAQWSLPEPAGIAIAANGKVVVPSTEDGTVLVIDSATGSSITTTRPDKSATNPDSISVRGNTVVLPGDDITWYDTVSGQFTGSLPPISPGVTSGSALLPGGFTLLTTRDFVDATNPLPGVLSLVRPGDHLTIATMPTEVGAAGVAVSTHGILVIQGPAANGGFSLLVIAHRLCAMMAG